MSQETTEPSASTGGGSNGPEFVALDWTGVGDPYNPGMDFPTGWAIQKRGGLTHDPRCSSRPEWGLLCDCGAIGAEWERLGKPTANEVPE